MLKLTLAGLAGALLIGAASLSSTQFPFQTGTTTPFFLDTCPWHGVANTAASGQRGYMMTDWQRCMGEGYGMSMARNHMAYTGTGIFCPWDAAEFSAWQKMNSVALPLDKTTALRWAEYYLAAYNNPDFVAGDITDKQSYFEVQIRSKKSTKVLGSIRIDKRTGWISPIQ